MPHRKHHDIWRGPIIECYGNPAKPPTCRDCACYDTCTRSKRGKSTCSAFSAAEKSRGKGNGKGRKGGKQRQKKASAQPAASPKHKRPMDWVARDLVRRGIFFTDERNRKDGCLWVRAGRTRQMEELMAEYASHGAKFRFSPEGSAATSHLPGWYLRGFPPNRGYSEEAAASARARYSDRSSEAAIQVDGKPAISAGDTVQHREFGAGRVRAIKRYGANTYMAEVSFGGEVRYITPRSVANGEVWRTGTGKKKKKKRGGDGA